MNKYPTQTEAKKKVFTGFVNSKEFAEICNEFGVKAT